MGKVLPRMEVRMKCWCCEKEAVRTRIVRNIGIVIEEEPSIYTRNYCNDCYEKEVEKDKTDKAEYIRLKKRMMFLTAVENLESQKVNMQKYHEAIDVVDEFINSNPDKFDSSYEVLAAIILVKNRIHCKMQYRIGKYQVDFFLPEHMVILEVDGERHKHRKDYDSQRDTEIKKLLQMPVEIIRIKTDFLDAKAERLVDAIDKVIEYRKTNHINWRDV